MARTSDMEFELTFNAENTMLAQPLLLGMVGSVCWQASIDPLREARELGEVREAVHNLGALCTQAPVP